MEQIDDVLFGGEPVDSPAMGKLREAAERADEVAWAIKSAEALLKLYNEEHRKLTTQTIPSLMAELGELSVVESSWGTVKLTPFWSAKITPATETKAFAWLNENGHGGIVKREINVPIPRGDDEYAAMVRAYLKGFSYEEKQGVHHQTLQGFVRAMAKAGTPVPQDLFNVYSGTVAKVTVTKE